jgi:uncharacterized membrane protein
MAMDLETVKFLRFLFGVVFACVGAAAGYRFYGLAGSLGGAVIGYTVGWNVVDFFKGRAHK